MELFRATCQAYRQYVFQIQKADFLKGLLENEKGLPNEEVELMETEMESWQRWI